MPLLHVMGVMCTNQSFSSCYVKRKRETTCGHSSKWRMYLTNEWPFVVVIDRQLALMATIAMVLPEATDLLCIWYIDKNELAILRNNFATDEERKSFYAKWGTVHRSETEEAFNERWVDLKHHVKDIGYAYLESVWNLYREKFVLAWAIKARHFGHVAASRFEGGFATLKKWTFVSTGGLASVYDKLMLAGQQ